jgi:hypothetical protein
MASGEFAITGLEFRDAVYLDLGNSRRVRYSAGAAGQLDFPHYTGSAPPQSILRRAVELHIR